MLDNRELSEALWRDCLGDASVVERWLINVGRKSALARIAHLIAEMATRCAQIGMLNDGVFRLQMTQEQIADAVGLTPVPVNRSIKTMQDTRLIQICRASVKILDWSALVAVAEFDPDYLQLPDVCADPRRAARDQLC
nr:helix-turn-helix domain-containing protein [Sphingomonas jejuensis]